MNRTLSLAGCLLLFGASAAAAQTVDQRIANGRTLATNCMQCHGVNGMQKSNGFDSLVGKSYSDLKEKLTSMKRKTGAVEADEEIMIIHAKAYTDAEIDAIAYFLSRP